MIGASTTDTQAETSAEQSPQDQGLIAVLGAKGGCGSTLVALHLAAELARTRSACVVDLDLSKGDVAGALDLWPERSLADLGPNMGHLDAELLRGVACRHRSGLWILPQPHRLQDAQELGPAESRALLLAALGAWGSVVCDGGSRSSASSMAAAALAKQILLVLTPDMPALRDARRLLLLLESIGVPLSRVRPIVNRLGRKPQIKVSVLAEELGLPIAHTLSKDPVSCDLADLEGRLVWDVAPLSTLAHELRTLSPGAEPRPMARWSLPWRR